MEKIRLEHICKSYNHKTPVINDFNLSIDDGEFVVLLGPSGCGKSTLLRIIAGLEPIDSGTIYLNGKNVNAVQPKDRDIAMVFQNYALYPHMTVYKNISISLELRHMPKQVIQEKVKAVADMLNLTDLLQRKPKQLSGGQMQRVALARAIVREPQLFLMDEPMSNLDAKLRVHTRNEIIKLCQRLKTTTIFVTHDQVEALTMATKIVVMHKGVIQQQGTPEELYEKPENLFVAGFIGTPQMNFLPAVIYGGSLQIGAMHFPTILPDSEVIAGVRPEWMELTPGDTFQVDFIENLGSEKFAYLRSVANPELQVRVKCDMKEQLTRGNTVNLRFSPDHVHVFDAKTERRLPWR